MMIKNTLLYTDSILIFIIYSEEKFLMIIFTYLHIFLHIYPLVRNNPVLKKASQDAAT